MTKFMQFLPIKAFPWGSLQSCLCMSELAFLLVSHFTLSSYRQNFKHSHMLFTEAKKEQTGIQGYFLSNMTILSNSLWGGENPHPILFAMLTLKALIIISKVILNLGLCRHSQYRLQPCNQLNMVGFLLK